MRPLILTVLFLPLPLFLTQCVDVENPSPPSYAGPHQSSYDLGMTRGQADGRTGQSRTPARYVGSYPAVESAAFLQGYEAGYNQGINPGTKPASFGQPLTVKTFPGRITIYEGTKALSTCATASPNVETTKFINEQQQIVVKSRGNHGPATLQLFDSRSGAENGLVMAFDVKNGQPTWAAGMGE